MEKIRLQGLDELKVKENLPSVPELVQQYLDTKKRKAAGEFFRIAIHQKSNSHTGAGIAYSNELVIDKKTGDKWEQQYSTGMQQYRGAYNYEIDDWDLSLSDSAILAETENEVTYALRTGVGNIKVYRFKKSAPALVVSFNAREYESMQERIVLLGKIVDDAEAFRGYVEKELERRWYITSDAKLNEGNVVVLLADHADRDYDAISDLYRIYVWVKGKGFGVTQTHRTGLRHPGDKFYRVGIGLNATVVNQSAGAIDLAVEVRNRSQQWSAKHEICVEWKKPEKANPFQIKVDEAISEVVKLHQHNHPLYKPTRVTEKLVDAKSKIATWVLFEQIDTDRLTEYGEGWLGDQFRYSLWVMRGNKKPVQLFEDHVYIRPRSKSELTGTRGRDCSLKNLRLEDEKIKVSHPKGEKAEDQIWEDLTFSL
jgi:hypothetical protein